tara:strand:- start:18511 stop:19164 length:654 start_codon:yes stop_codon:yes gene_type:complete
MKEVYIIGARIDGHAGVVVDIINQLNEYKIVGFIDSTKSLQGTKVIDIPVIGSTENLEKLGLNNANFHIAIGDNMAREILYDKIKSIDGHLITLIHPSAIISPKVKIDDGTFVGARAVINNGTTVGKVCIVNTGAILEHDNIVGDAVHVAPGTVTAGRVVIHNLAFIGVGSTILPDIVVGKASLVGAGSTVTKDVVTSETVVGYAARNYKKKNIYIE